MRTAGSAEKEESWRRWRRVVCGVRSRPIQAAAPYRRYLPASVVSFSLLCSLFFFSFSPKTSLSVVSGDESRSTWRLFGGRFRRIQFGGGRHLLCSSCGVLGFRGVFRFW
ncbi:hypothetical protein IGI04_026214 [Brassica rapa subsp. trilocularis]|uniref:Transmembrane protein n=1 Tax=Brassica rapa subsp. trilocularis TaxID=1813537 RepID=A0ABQ7KWL4_BRACM|nr:hypothetical protein IGI04_026214 [Brassica rapa subsp. trilocularis]